MVAYNAPITVDIILKGERSIAKVIDQIEKVQSYIDKLTRKPIDLFSKKGGVGGDLAAKQRKVFQDLIRDIANAGTGIEGAATRSRILGNTLATTSEKAQLLSDALENVKIARGGIARQTAAVKNLTAAFNVAENEAKDYQKRLNDIIRTSKGLQLQAVRDAEVERRKRAVRDRAPRTRLGGIEPGGGYKNLEANLKRIEEQERQIRQGRLKDAEKLKQLAALNKGIERSLAKMSEEGIKRLRLQSTLNQLKEIEADLQEKIATDARKERLENKKRFIAGAREAQARRKQFREDLFLGAGFPLLTGAGPGGVLGGVAGAIAGGGKGGFGAQIFFSAIGSAVDEIVGRLIAGASALGQALDPVTANIDAIVKAAGIANTTLARDIQKLEEAGLKSTALAVATQNLASIVGTQGVNSLREFGSDTQKLSNEFAKAMTQMQAAVASFINSTGILKAAFGALEEITLFEQAKTTKDPRVALAMAQFRGAERDRDKGTTFGLPPSPRLELEVTKAKENVLKVQRQVNKEEAQNILGLTRAALDQKRNLNQAKVQLDTAQKQISAEKTVSDFIEQQAKAQQAQTQFDKKRNDVVTNYEKSLGNLRRNIEDQISTVRLNNLKKENQIKDQEAANELARLRNQQAAAGLFTAGTTGNPALRQQQESLRAAADAYNLKVVETEQKQAKLKRDSALNVQEIEFRSNRFKLDVARRSAELALDAENKINQINKEINERNAKFDETRFNRELGIAKLRLEVLKREAIFFNQQLADQAKQALDIGDTKEAQRLRTNYELNQAFIKDLEKSVSALANVKPPQALTAVSGLTRGTLDLTEYNNLLKEQVQLEENLNQTRLSGISAELEAEGLNKLKASSDILRQVEIESLEALTARNRELEKSARLSELTKQLGSQALAQELTNIEFATRLQEQKIDLVQTELEGQQAALETKVLTGQANETEIKQLERIKELLQQVNILRGNVSAAEKELKDSAKGEIETFIEQAQDRLNNLQALAVRVSEGIGNAIGNSLNNGISQLIEGSATVKEVFADMLKSIGQILVQEGTKMIATYIAIGIAKAFAGLSSGFTAGKPMGLESNMNSLYGGTNPFAGFQTLPFKRASGGPVERNRPYMVGEQGPELFTPSQAGRISSTSETRSLLGRSPVGNAPAMNFTFETTNIGGQEFVSREQLEAAMAVTRRQAANDGANRGMSMTLDKMQHSPATRRRVGIS